MEIKPFELERYFALYEFSAKYLLSSSDCQSMSITDLLALSTGKDKRQFQGTWLGYTESQGNPILRQEIAKLYEQANPDQNLVVAAPEELIFVLMNTLLEKADHVITVFPAYQSLYSVPEAIGCKVSYWKFKEKDGKWELDLGDLEKIIQPNTKLLVLNFPHNPTGFLPDKKFLGQVTEIARKKGIFIFSDEVYRGLEHHDKDRLPSIPDIYERGFALGAMSKIYGAAGLRMGWIYSAQPQAIPKMVAFKDYTTICNSALSEAASILLLRNKGKIITRNLKIITDNLGLLDKFFKKHEDKFLWHKPKAGSIAFPKMAEKHGIMRLCKDLVMKKGVMLLPGPVYGIQGNYFRIGFGRKNMDEALNLFDEYLAERA